MEVGEASASALAAACDRGEEATQWTESQEEAVVQAVETEEARRRGRPLEDDPASLMQELASPHVRREEIRRPQGGPPSEVAWVESEPEQEETESEAVSSTVMSSSEAARYVVVSGSTVLGELSTIDTWLGWLVSGLGAAHSALL